MARDVTSVATKGVWPVLKSRGWRRSGLRFGFENDRGDWALLTLRRRNLIGLTDRNVFVVDAGFLPAAGIEIYRFLRDDIKSPIAAEEGWSSSRMGAPAAAQFDDGYGLFGEDEWMIAEHNSEQVREALTAVTDFAAPELERLLDNELFIHLAHANGVPGAIGPTLPSGDFLHWTRSSSSRIIDLAVLIDLEPGGTATDTVVQVFERVQNAEVLAYVAQKRLRR